MIKNSIKHYVLVFLCAFSVSAAANVQDNGPLANRVSDKSYFDQLGEAFANAAPAQESYVLGWTSGRCFYKSTPNRARNSLIAGFIDGDLVDYGLTPRHKYSIVESSSIHANYFDNFIDDNPNLVELMESLIINEAKPSTQKDRSLVAYFSSNTRWNVRKGTIGLESDTEYLLLGISYPDGTKVTPYCYYFKKIRE